MVVFIALLFGWIFIALGWLFNYLAKTNDDNVSYRRYTIAGACFLIGLIIIFIAIGILIGMHI